MHKIKDAAELGEVTLLTPLATRSGLQRNATLTIKGSITVSDGKLRGLEKKTDSLVIAIKILAAEKPYAYLVGNYLEVLPGMHWTLNSAGVNIPRLARSDDLG